MTRKFAYPTPGMPTLVVNSLRAITNRMKQTTLLLLVVFAAVCSASPVTFSGVSVTCRELGGPTTETLTVTVDPAVNGGRITAGVNNLNNCYFSLSGNALASPFTNGNYNYTSPLDAVCYHTGGLCLTGTSLITLNISPVASGQLFTIVASSITTTFTLGPTTAPDPVSPTPEPESLMLAGFGLTILGLVSRNTGRRI